MLYDVHTHVGCDSAFYLRSWWPYAATVQDLVQHMDASRIDRAAAFTFCTPSAFDAYAFAERGEVKLLPGRFPFDRENDLLATEIERVDTGKRLMQFGMFDPMREVAKQVKSLERLASAKRLTGLKTQATIIQSTIRSLLDVGRDLMLLAERYNLPIVIHTSIIDDDSWSQTRDCLDVAEAYPNVRFNLAHSFRFHLPSIQRAARMPNVWSDNSAHLVHCQLAAENFPTVAKPAERLKADYTKPVEVLLAVNEAMGGKSLWGSDNPYMSWCDDTIAAIYTYKAEADVLHALPEATRTQIGTRNAEAWLYGR